MPQVRRPWGKPDHTLPRENNPMRTDLRRLDEYQTAALESPQEIST